MTAYEELLEFGGERIFDFLKNARLHESQFKYSEFNEVCYKKMYIEIGTVEMLLACRHLMDKSISQFAARQICKQPDSLVLIVSQLRLPCYTDSESSYITSDKRFASLCSAVSGFLE